MNWFLIVVVAAALPTFEDFRRIDRSRRFTGQMLTAEFLEVSQIDAGAVVRVTREHPADSQILLGAAELLTDWSRRRTFYEAALEQSGTNAGIAVRFACAAAHQRDFELARALLKDCRKLDADNAVPWLAEFWILRQQGQPLVLSNSPPMWATSFRDYSVEASRARIRTLEAIGYSPYAARRLGFSPDSPAVGMARDLGRSPSSEQSASLLKETAQSLQRHAPFLLWEFVGQTIERTLLQRRPDAATSVEVRFRTVEMDKRREELMTLLADIERNTVEFASEEQMVQYFDSVLDVGEEAAMKKLAEAVRAAPASQ